MLDDLEPALGDPAPSAERHDVRISSLVHDLDQRVLVVTVVALTLTDLGILSEDEGVQGSGQLSWDPGHLSHGRRGVHRS